MMGGGTRHTNQQTVLIWRAMLTVGLTAVLQLADFFPLTSREVLGMSRFIHLYINIGPHVMFLLARA